MGRPFRNLIKILGDKDMTWVLAIFLETMRCPSGHECQRIPDEKDLVPPFPPSWHELLRGLIDVNPVFHSHTLLAAFCSLYYMRCVPHAFHTCLLARCLVIKSRNSIGLSVSGSGPRAGPICDRHHSAILPQLPSSGNSVVVNIGKIVTCDARCRFLSGSFWTTVSICDMSPVGAAVCATNLPCNNPVATPSGRLCHVNNTLTLMPSHGACFRKNQLSLFCL